VRTRLLGALLLLVLAGGAAVGQTPSSASKAAGSAGGADAIKAVADAYVKATLAGDAKAIAALYTEDAIEMPPNQPMIKGRAAIQQYYEKEMGSGMKMNTFTVTHLDTQAAGDRGYDVGTYSQSVTPKGATAPVSDTGKYVVILRRSAAGWHVSHAIYNSDQPPSKM
jgi:uncharacterized protein (TIGR02246 family)